MARVQEGKRIISLSGIVRAGASVIGLITFVALADANELRVPAHVTDRQHSFTVIYRLDRPMTGTAHLQIEWSDALGRIVERRALDRALRGTQDIKFQFDPRKAVAIRNTLHIRLALEALDAGGRRRHQEGEESATFTIAPAEQAWSDYQIIMWHERTVAQLAILKQLGITAGKVNGNRIEMADQFMAQQAEPLIESNLRWYVENIATDFYSAYHRWFPDHPENWRFLEAKQRYRNDPTSTAPFVRDPSLSDPLWLEKIRERLAETVRLHRPYRPLYYNLGDEPGVQDLASFWDFDFSEPSLQQLRLWLRERYPSLSALNQEWDSHFASWDDVVPMTTRAAMQRVDDNYAAWADFKEWMDVAFARALRTGTDTVHAADPEALAGIEGAQIPGWGGYNYAHLSHAVDLMEIYDFAGNIDVVRSLNPEMIFLTTSGAGSPADEYQIWRELLRGSRGVILWDDKSNLVRPDGSLGTAGQFIGPLFHELRRGLGALLINSDRDTDPIAVLYSPESMRTQWMLDQKPKGDAWIERNADAEYEDNAVRAATRYFTEVLEDLGLHYRFITSDLIEQGVLQRDHVKVLLLPHALALSPAAAETIRRFVRQGGVVVADSEPGIFDQHSRRLAVPLLKDLFPANPERSPSPVFFGRGELIYFIPPTPASGPAGEACLDGASLTPLANIVAASRLKARFQLLTVAGGPATNVQSYIFRNGDTAIAVLQRERCRSPSGSGSADGESRESITLVLPSKRYIYDVRERRFLGERGQIEILLDSNEPTVLALSPTRLAAPTVWLPRQVRLGKTAALRVQLSGVMPTAKRALHVDVIDPTGEVNAHYSGNLIATGGTATKLLTFGLNDDTGTWQIRVIDSLSGRSRTANLFVSKP